MSTPSVIPANAKGLVSPTQKQNNSINDKLVINQLHQQFSVYGKNAREWLRKCALLLPEIEEKQVWRRKGFSSIHEYAAKLAGMSRYAVDDALRILRRIEDKPVLRELVAEVGINRVRSVVAIATQETQEFWAKKVKTMSKHTLATYVHDYRLEFGPGPESQPVKVNISLKLKPDLAKRLEKLKTEGDIEVLLERFLDQVEAEASQGPVREQKEQAHGLTMESVSLPADIKAQQPITKPQAATKSPVTKPQPVATSSRYIPAAIKRYVINKYYGLCAYKTCKHPYKILHHTQRFALEKVHDPDRLMPLCKEHERIAHQGLIAHEEAAPEQWRIREEVPAAAKDSPKHRIDMLVMARRKAG